MRIVADLHVHSKYARATSPKCDIKGLAEGAKTKGIDVIATGDFTHPTHFTEIKSHFRNEEEGLFPYGGARFILSTEISLIYSDKDRTYKMHHIVLSPSLEVVEQIIDVLGKHGNLAEDGRPILGISSAEFAEKLFELSDELVIIPAHVWTPWFGLFGSKSGVDSIEDAFEDKAGRIFALETGLSSDPQMNWMLSSLDRYTLVSNSDSHSLEKLGREANVFELEKVSYKSVMEAIKTRKGFVKTYEFYPEEGKYHYDGHRKCGIRWPPEETDRHHEVCPVCRRKVTVGVMHRVCELADRKYGFVPENAIPFQHIVPLTTVISKVICKGEKTAAVLREYNRLIEYFGNEFAVFEAGVGQIKLATTPEIAAAIEKVKSEDVAWLPGYDGVFGELVLDGKTKKGMRDRKQKSLSEF